MLTITILSQKGGAGKTTLSLNMAVAAELSGKAAAVIDLDPQASAAGWSDIREEESPVIMSVPSSRLNAVLEAARDGGADIAFIDTAPHSEADALAAAKVADLVLIPCRPTILDINAVGRTVNLVELARVPAVFVLNAVPPTGSVGDEAEEALGQYRLPIAPTRMVHRAAYYHAMTAGQGVQEFEPAGKAAEEVKSVYKFISKHVNMKSDKQPEKAHG